MRDLYELSEGYIEYLKILNRSAKTIKNVQWSLDKFIKFLKEYQIRDVQDVRSEHIFEYQRYRHYYQNRFMKGDDVKCQNQHLSVVKGFFRYLKIQDDILKDPTLDVKYAKEPVMLPKSALTDAEMKTLLKQPDTNTLVGYRDRTILELLYSSGLRKSELIHLKVEDVNDDEGYLRVNQGKGNRDRVIPIGRIALKYVETYIKGIRPMFLNARTDKTLFLSQRGQRIGRNTFDQMIMKYVKRTSLKKSITAHTFRRSCATEMIKNKANLMHVKELLGHRSLKTVQAYCDLSIVDLKEAHRKCHPREKD